MTLLLLSSIPAGPVAGGWGPRSGATDLLHLAVYVQIVVPLHQQQVQLLPQGCVPNQLDVKAAGDLGVGQVGDKKPESVSGAWPATLHHTQIGSPPPMWGS